jgi:hypothetical protein
VELSAYPGTGTQLAEADRRTPRRQAGLPNRRATLLETSDDPKCSFSDEDPNYAVRHAR